MGSKRSSLDLAQASGLWVFGECVKRFDRSRGCNVFILKSESSTLQISLRLTTRNLDRVLALQRLADEDVLLQVTMKEVCNDAPNDYADLAHGRVVDLP